MTGESIFNLGVVDLVLMCLNLVILIIFLAQKIISFLEVLKIVLIAGVLPYYLGAGISSFFASGLNTIGLAVIVIVLLYLFSMVGTSFYLIYKYKKRKESSGI